jgi:hypothetical protein
MKLQSAIFKVDSKNGGQIFNVIKFKLAMNGNHARGELNFPPASSLLFRKFLHFVKYFAIIS